MASANDFGSLEGRIRDLEQRLSSQATLPFITSTGILQQRLPSNTVTTTQQNSLSQTAFATGESLQYNQIGTVVVNNSATNIVVVRIPVRPDPVVGDLYRITIAGNFQNAPVTQFAIDIKFGGVSANLIVSTASVSAGAFFGMEYFNVTTAGPAGAFTQSGFQIISTSGQSFIDASCYSSPAAGANLVGPVFEVDAGFTAATGTANIFIRALIVESLGFRQG